MALSDSILSSLLMTYWHITHCTLALALCFTGLGVVAGVVAVVAAAVVLVEQRPKLVHSVAGS